MTVDGNDYHPAPAPVHARRIHFDYPVASLESETLSLPATLTPGVSL